MSTSRLGQTDTSHDDPQLLIEELMKGLRETANEVVPWFAEQMPLVYFQDTDHETRLSHLRAIIAAKASGQPPTVTLRSEDDTHWTFIRPMNFPGILAEMVGRTPTDQPLRAAKIHTAADGQLVLDVFEFGEQERFSADDAEQTAKLNETIEMARVDGIDWTEEEIREHFSNCTAEYVLTATPYRIWKHWELCQRVSGTDGTAVELEEEADPSVSRIVVAVGNSRTRTMLERAATRLSRYSIDIHRAYLDMFDDPGNGQISVIGFVVQDPEGNALDVKDELWEEMRLDLLRVKWIDNQTLELSDRHLTLGVARAEIILALCNLAHQVLVKENPYAFARDRLFRLAERHLPVAIQIADLFADRFRPSNPLEQEGFRERSDSIREEIGSVDLEDARSLLFKLLDAVHASHRTNLYLDERYGLAIRIDPAYLLTKERDELPYGVFFVHGRGFNGFHVRFRDIARGGVRVVRPIGVEQHARESERLYDEAYGLAFAQQLKNKDIPEGGSKAVILVEPDEKIDRCAKSFADCLLDLITPDPETRRHIVDRVGRDEILYLGPDENITPRIILWIVDRAARRGYPMPNSLMSSKPGAGINHKEYGVTSEGVTVFLESALRHVGIDPRHQPFTIKITGGPDGDVAGNEIRILHRDFGENARIVGIADGSGCAEDPDGLDHAELLRLVENSDPISRFDRDLLGDRGRVVTVDETDGYHIRNNMHNRVKADAFVPAGGRPRSIHLGNWKQFLLEDGTPSSRVIVEGANLFLTPDARQELSDRGTIIVKDSSANKCGVICSSFEIVASMLLCEEEFLAIKDQFVKEVLQRLRSLAQREAQLLFREHRLSPQVPLPQTSTRLSRVIIRASDAIDASLDDLDAENWPILRQLVFEHLPPVLVETAGERIWERLPSSYLQWIIATSLAARIVYREGLLYLESMPMAAIADLALRYLRQEKETAQLIQEIASSDLDHRRRVAELLERSGTRAGLRDVE